VARECQLERAGGLDHCRAQRRASRAHAEAEARGTAKLLTLDVRLEYRPRDGRPRGSWSTVAGSVTSPKRI